MVAWESVEIQSARSILQGQSADLDEMWELANRLILQRQFGYARRLLKQARMDAGSRVSPEFSLRLAQQHAVCTYKDPDLPAAARLDRALAILEEGDRLQTTGNQETLGIAGSIYKRKWEVTGQHQYLERARAYYRRGYEQGDVADYGYCGINLAFVLDLLAHQEQQEAQRSGVPSETADARRREAMQIRQSLVAKLPDLISQQPAERLDESWWYLVTIAEAHFGLSQYPESLLWLKRAAALTTVQEWERETTTRQLASLAYLIEREKKGAQAMEERPAWRTLCEFLGNNAAGVRSAFVGKVGLALSGGGFRASLFHIGVLAKLAELDVLRSVEVLSCVSGGSIIGAHYYLEVRRLLQQKADCDIRREDYIEIVQKIERDFLAGVQRNIRTRVAAEFWTNVKMLLKRHYSRTLRIGELFEREIFSRVRDGEEKTERWLNQLQVCPKDEPTEFAPVHHNWRRHAKVPILILNATTLNTGHNWQFTVSWMGVPPSGIDPEVDCNSRLRRMYYHKAPPGYRSIRLGHAVAASACVPGIFEPIAFPRLYDDPKMVVRLVDGGVYDNQGISGLQDEDCTVLLVSDASGHMQTLSDPGAGLLGVPLRANGILMARVRAEQYHELESRRRASLLKGLMFTHLKKDLDIETMDWVGCVEPQEAPAEARSGGRQGTLTRYGVPKRIQELLAGIRTDLDSFSDVEAYALMTSGYRMTEYEFPRCINGFAEPTGPRPMWRFLAIEGLMKREVGSFIAYLEMEAVLTVASRSVLKYWRLSRPLRIAAAAMGLLILSGLARLFKESWEFQFGINATVGALVIAAAALPVLFQAVWLRKTLSQIGLGTVMCVLGWLGARLHLRFFDRWYLERGRIDRFVSQ